MALSLYYIVPVVVVVSNRHAETWGEENLTNIYLGHPGVMVVATDHSRRQPNHRTGLGAWGEVHAFVLCDRAGQASGLAHWIVNVNDDITDMIQAEESHVVISAFVVL